MTLSDFDFNLPEELIAQTPIKERDFSRLLCVNKKSGELSDNHFYDIIDKLCPGDTLILNNSKVLPARIFGSRQSGAKVEFLLLKRINDTDWKVLVKPGKKAKIGDKFTFNNDLQAEIIDIVDDGQRIVRFIFEKEFYEILDSIGSMPLPPYIKESLKDKDRYQTVYADPIGSAAAPTAGLHFTKDLLEKVKNKGINIGYVTLHVGLGTFRPVKDENFTEHKMHSESFYIPPETVDLIRKTKENKKRVIAVGTTSTRTLESAFDENLNVIKDKGNTNIFIYPGYKFKVIDALITNFHLPKSTLIMLVSAFSTREIILNAYKHAIDEKYRFFSFGDAMFLY